MKKFYRITLLLVVLIFLSTFNPTELNLISKKNDTLFKIKNIVIKNNLLINKNEINEKLSNIYKKKFLDIQKNFTPPKKKIFGGLNTQAV